MLESRVGRKYCTDSIAKLMVIPRIRAIIRGRDVSRVRENQVAKKYPKGMKPATLTATSDQ